MTVMKCSNCGADLIPGTGFCRQCGSRPIVSGEQPTAILNQPPDGTTRRLEPELSREDTAVSASRVVRSPRFVVFAIILVTILSVVGIAALRRSSIFSGTTELAAPVSRDLVYPGSRVVLDLTQDQGAAVLQLETSDPLNKVQAWYMGQLKPDKI